MRVIIGFHAITEALRSKASRATLYVHRSSHKRNIQLIELAKSVGIPVSESGVAELDQLSGGSNHRGALLIIEGGSNVPLSRDLSSFLEANSERHNSLVIALDGVTDPHNLGAVLRSADLFGVDLLLLPERRSVRMNQTVLKVASGAAEYVPYASVTNMVRALQRLKEHGYWVYGAHMRGRPVDTVNLTGKSVIVLGAEGKGISTLVEKSCDSMVSVPTDGHIDSLNISVAAGIIMYEIGRQRSGGALRSR